MQNKIIIYEPIELKEDNLIKDSKLYQKMRNINNIEVCVSFFEE
jgi:hypothetical protein